MQSGAKVARAQLASVHVNEPTAKIGDAGTEHVTASRTISLGQPAARTPYSVRVRSVSKPYTSPTLASRSQSPCIFLCARRLEVHRFGLSVLPGSNAREHQAPPRFILTKVVSSTNLRPQHGSFSPGSALHPQLTVLLPCRPGDAASRVRLISESFRDAASLHVHSVGRMPAANGMSASNSDDHWSLRTAGCDSACRVRVRITKECAKHRHQARPSDQRRTSQPESSHTEDAATQPRAQRNLAGQA